jgi:hypothetical protein
MYAAGLGPFEWRFAIYGGVVLVGRISSLADRLVARFVPEVDAAASDAAADPVCGWQGCGYECLIRTYCCDRMGCYYDPCYWAC